MSKPEQHFSLVIIGAGAAGLGASVYAMNKGIDHCVLEASHRIGGRGLTEHLTNGCAIDLGCHWMHSASKNCMVEMADQLGFPYSKANSDYAQFVDGHWQNNAFQASWRQSEDSFHQKVFASAERNEDISLWDCMDEESIHLQWHAYWLSLMHSNDPDQVALKDITEYDETGEDWAVEQGYGSLVAAAGQSAPVQLNTAVQVIEWREGKVNIKTNAGSYSADKVIVTVSNGVLASNNMQFDPLLPAWKLEAIKSLPMGNYNNLFFSLKEGAIPDAPAAIAYTRDDQTVSIKIRPFGEPYLFACTGGRFAWWLEKQGERASENWLRGILVDMFGDDINAYLGQFKASAWGFDPWVLGAYTSALPGSGWQRGQLAAPVENALYFAGEATSLRNFNTAHGAWMSGQRATDEAFPG